MTCQKTSIYQRLQNLRLLGGGKISIGKGVLNDNTFVCSDGGLIVFEENVTLNRNSIVVCRDSIFVGSGTSIGPNVCIYDHDHKFDFTGFRKDEFRTGGVYIGRNCWIAANVVILRNTIIGDNCVIGAGVIISGTIEPNTLVRCKHELIYEKLNKNKL